MIQFIMLFAVMLFLSGIAINGFYNITRGDWYTKPDGDKYWDGKIFSFWSKFLQTHTVMYDNYSGNEFLKEFAKIKDGLQADIIAFAPNTVLVKRMDHKKASLFFSYALSKGVLTNMQDYPEAKDQVFITIFKERKVYKLPNWIRAPFGECITCMASAFGVGCFLFWYGILFLIQHIYPTNAAQAFLELSIPSKAGLLIFFCTSLAWVNEIIFNINHKLKQ